MKKSRVFTLGLACFLTAVTALGVVPITSGGGGVFGDNYAGSSAPSATATTPLNATQNGKNNAQNLTPQEQLLAGTLELEPENDPVVYTTDYGLDIKWHMASPLPTNPGNLQTTTVSSTTWAYFSAGGLDWIIIGYSNKSSIFSTGAVNLGTVAYYYDNLSYFSFTNSSSGIWQWFASGRGTPAWDTLFNDYLNKGKDVIYNLTSQTISQKAVFTNAAASSELETNEVLCLLSGNYTNTTFGSNNVYSSSNLRTYINSTIYPLVKDLPIVAQPLTTAGSEDITEYLFPLGSTGRASTESFAVENYLNSTTKRDIDIQWWLRSGNSSNSGYVYSVTLAGSIYYTTAYVGDPLGLRPAFVLKI